ncbi:Hypothetical predicted protein, partial [Mytilus galloprovincialis]
SFVLVTVVHADIAGALFLNECPGKPMWNLRANNLCGALDKYMCLYDTNEGKFRELCKDAPEFHRPGNIFIISGNLQYFAGRPCKSDKYQPHKWWTNGSSDCQYLKSTCNEEGQVPYDNGTISRDTKCRCDYTNYYTFVSSTRNKCFCDPTEEDCSCNRKKCYYDQVLTPDYDCVGIHAWTGQFVCPEYKAPKFTDKKTLQRRTTICPLIKQDFSGTVQQSSARIAHSSMLGAIIVLDIARELKASGFYKIRLLKNYDRIVKEIVPMEILPKIPYFMISEGDRCDVMDIESQHKKTRALLNILLNSDKSIYNAFLAALRQDAVYEELAKDIEMTPGRHNKLLRDWRADIKTKESETVYMSNLYSNIFTENVIVIIGTSRCGKSSDLHSVALIFLDLLDFDIIPCTKLSEFIDYHNPDRCQMFLFELDEINKDDFLKELNEESEKIRSMHMQGKGDIKQKIVISISCDTCWLNQKKEIYPNISCFVDNCLIYP